MKPSGRDKIRYEKPWVWQQSRKTTGGPAWRKATTRRLMGAGLETRTPLKRADQTESGAATQAAGGRWWQPVVTVMAASRAGDEAPRTR